MTIVSSDGSVLDGGGLTRIFDLKKGSDGTVISGLTFINGRYSMSSAINIRSQNITISDCIFENNTGTDNGGGAVATAFNQKDCDGLTIKNSIFKCNSAPASSGAVAAFSTNFKILSCIFENNYALNNVGRSAYEGALQVGMNGTQGLVYNCTFRNNYVKSDNETQPSRGGAMGLRKGTVVENCLFVNNSADWGGALIYLTGGEVRNSTFLENFAEYGGAVACENSSICDVLIHDSHFEKNHAKFGGSIFMNNNGNITISASSFECNYAQNGGVIYSNASKMEISNCIFTKNNASDDGGVFYSLNNLQITNSTFTYNFAKNGGVLFINSKSIIVNSDFRNNYASKNGGVIHNSGNLSVEKSYFGLNHAVNGGVIYSENVLFLNASKFINNYAIKFGGAIYNLGDLKAIGSQFQNNKANSKITAKLSSKKKYVNCSDNAVIKVTFEGGNNVKDAIWSKSSVEIDGKQIKPNNKIASQKITFKINGKTYAAKTDKNGVATFKFNTKKFKVKNHKGTFTFAGSKKYSQSSTKINLKITKKVVYKIKIKNKKKIKTKSVYQAYVTKFYFKKVKYVIEYYNTKSGKVVYYNEGYKKISLSKKYWKTVSKKSINGKYKWYKSKFKNVYTYKATKITYKYVNGVFVKKSVNKNYKYKKTSKYKNKRTKDWSKYVLPSVDCESDHKLIIAKSKKIIKDEAKRLGKSVNKLTDEQKANAILNWVQEKIHYRVYGDTRKGALNTLKQKKGNCVDQSHLSVALLRAANIPAKYESKYANNMGHAWHWSYFKNKWWPGESTADKKTNYGKHQDLNNFIKQKSSNGLDKMSYKFISKYVFYNNKWVKKFEVHLINDVWEIYYGNNWESSGLTSNFDDFSNYMVVGDSYG